MRILLLSHSFNSLTQRLHVELRDRGHDVAVELDIHAEVTRESVALHRPDLVIAPFLKQAISQRRLAQPAVPGRPSRSARRSRSGGARLGDSGRCKRVGRHGLAGGWRVRRRFGLGVPQLPDAARA
ncbi:hypothetical protein QA633_07315 [Bradyrhizobium barranii]|uniref:hypothetical protein n=1 Tax=Bradyrhizobium TaxID=374 RepID=UPI0024B21A7D|nr:hypothetical protein [Bradyrhizobium barranii]WFT96884.1 hypothetical protein QA633_07315 [Bradyrhizobium barranii]